MPGVQKPHWAAPTSTEATQIALRDEPVTMRRLGALRRNPNTMRDNLLLADPELAAAEVMEYRKAGGRSIVDQSSIGTGRSPRAIRDLANQAGINVIMGCGFYLKGGLAPSLAEETEEELARMVLGEIRNGVGDTGVRPGIIGEIGMRPAIEEWETKSLRVAARAHL